VTVSTSSLKTSTQESKTTNVGREGVGASGREFTVQRVKWSETDALGEGGRPMESKSKIKAMRGMEIVAFTTLVQCLSSVQGR
jgi:hypothetical protein